MGFERVFLCFFFGLKFVVGGSSLEEKKFIRNIKFNLFIKFQKFLIKYNKKYNTIAEYLLRYNQCLQKKFTKIFSNKASYKIGINQFTDLTSIEFRKEYLNLDMKLVNKINYKKVSVNTKNDAPRIMELG